MTPPIFCDTLFAELCLSYHTAGGFGGRKRRLRPVTFPEFFELMYDCIGGDSSQANFFRSLFAAALEDSEVPFPDMEDVHCNGQATGKEPISLPNLRLVLKHMDRGGFRKFVEHNAPPSKPVRERLVQKYLALFPDGGEDDPRTDLGRAYANLFYQVLEGELDRRQREKKQKQAERRRLKLDPGGPVRAPVAVRLPTPAPPPEVPWYAGWRPGVVCPLWNDPVKRASIVNVTTDLASRAVTAFLTLGPRPALGRSEPVAYAGMALRLPKAEDLKGTRYLTFELRNQGLQRLQVVLEPRGGARPLVTVPCYGPTWERVILPMDQLCPDGNQSVFGVCLQAEARTGFVSDQMMGWFSVRDLQFQ